MVCPIFRILSLTDDKTVFTINSMTKAFTGVAIMQLVEQGKLDVNVAISKYLTDLPEDWRYNPIITMLKINLKRSKHNQNKMSF